MWLCRSLVRRVVLRNTRWGLVCSVNAAGAGWPLGAPRAAELAAEAVEGAALALEGVDDVHGGDGLAAGVLGVGDSITDDGLHEGLQDAAGLLVNEAADALDATTACETADGRLGDPLDVVPEHLAVTLSATLAESLASFSASRHY